MTAQCRTKAGANRNVRGFTLVEVIGVLAVMAILAALLAPNVIDQIRRAAYVQEQENLKTLVVGLEQHILLNKNIPRDTQQVVGGVTVPAWDAAIANQVNIAQSKVNANDRGNTRYYAWDTAAAIDPDQPYNQTPATADAITSTLAGAIRPRIIIASSSNSAITGTITADDPPLSANDFADLWDWEDGSSVGWTADLTAAFGFGAEIAKRDLVVQRFNTALLFHEVSLLSRSVSKTGNAFFGEGVDSAAASLPKNLLSVPNDTRIKGLSIQSDSLGGAVTVDIGCTVDGDCTDTYFFGGQSVATGWSGNSGADDLIVDGGDSMIRADIASGTTENAGYISVTVEYDAIPGFDLDNSGTVQTIDRHTCSTDGTEYDTRQDCLDDGCADVCFPVETQFFVIQGTKLSLIDSAAAGATLHTIFINASDSFWYAPGPPAAWGR